MARPSAFGGTFFLAFFIVTAVFSAASNVLGPHETVARFQDAPAAKPEPPLSSPSTPPPSTSPTQPLPYSHKKHLALGLECQDCHSNPEPGDRMTFPATSKCMTCHTSIAKDKPSIQKLAAFAKSGTPIPWVRVYSLPPWVYWNHRSHLEAQMTCEMCHGRVQEREVMTKITNVTTMAGCIDCHRKNDVSTGCKYCHSDK